ncbi:peptide-methionine (S)-S-oxide reductase MsrA [Vibrio sp. SCSIO 43140]|uniref:peptide-methionine (S)-S-oxide reductase MsrA n=1 Tax=Vibrio TaxID=662 RepID=UPI00207630A2|nr:peptide-methionine (S)-S-oxide reductase MsrA [Vibrio sp. SCSIO 43140]USD60754.1 peptide-methionine (S)-S-oxide reductase MsrA [Vibrio sp. SCSIO 43140]
MGKKEMISSDQALPGRDVAIAIMEPHFVNQSDLNAELNQNEESIVLGLGCFWGAERLFWQLPGVISTSVGYSGGFTPNPTYEEVCSGLTGHTEVVRVVFDTTKTSLQEILRTFWEKHDPTQGMRQGNDIGTQYRSAIYTASQEQDQIARQTQQQYQQALGSQGITTEILPLGEYYFAEIYHQQYLAKNPNGYCGIGGTGVCFPPELNP